MKNQSIASLFVDAQPPAAAPVKASRWIPLAHQHGMSVDFGVKCVSVVGADVVEFWGDDFAEQDVGAAVLKVAASMKQKAKPDFSSEAFDKHAQREILRSGLIGPRDRK
jgi:hypothetical protein